MYDIGIMTGSGPDAGIDLWRKVLDATRRRLGSRYCGDVDAPGAMVLSDPRLGASMNLPSTDAQVRAVVVELAAQLDDECRQWVIACNTLNVYAPMLVERGIGYRFVSFVDVVECLVGERPGTWCLLGAQPVASLGRWSPYARIADRCVRLDDDVLVEVHRLIERAKRVGLDDATVCAAFAEIVSRLDADHIALACTELPPIASHLDDHRFVDVTTAVADQLAATFVGSKLR